MTNLDGISVSIEADTSSFDQAIKDSERLARGLGSALSRAFGDAIIRGKDFGDVMRGLALRISSLAINAAFKPIEQSLAGMFQGMFANTMQGNSFGGAFSMPTTPFASGGIVSTPTYFPLGPSLGVAGERGAEAILPLARGADGKLGVRAGEGKPASITVHVSTPDSASFRRSEAYVASAIARAVSRGERNL
jgi:phage-related minor tail protein